MLRGIVPKKAPKTGINAVTPITTLINKAYGIFKIIIPIKHKTPITRASVHCPNMNLENISLHILPSSIILSALFLLTKAYIISFS